MAALIKQATGLEAEIIEGRRGEFTIWVDDEVVAQKAAGAFPDDRDALGAVQKALTSRTDG